MVFEWNDGNPFSDPDRLPKHQHFMVHLSYPPYNTGLNVYSRFKMFISFFMFWALKTFNWWRWLYDIHGFILYLSERAVQNTWNTDELQLTPWTPFNWVIFSKVYLSFQPWFDRIKSLIYPMIMSSEINKLTTRCKLLFVELIYPWNWSKPKLNTTSPTSPIKFMKNYLLLDTLHKRKFPEKCWRYFA